MNRIAILVSAVLAGVFSPPQQAQAQSGLRRVCYYTNWSQYRNGAAKFTPDNVDPTLCTHLVYAFAKMVGNNIAPFEWNDESTDWSVGMYARFQALKSGNSGVKTQLAVGGWNMGSGSFTQMVASPTSRAQFAESVVAFLRKWGFDGLDVDWEYPANRGSPPQDRDRFTDLLRELRAKFEQEAASNGRPRLLLTAAVAAGKPNIDTAYDIPAINQYLDFINLMTYDLHGSWETYTGHHAALFPRAAETGDDRYLNVDWAAKYWVQKGATPSKLNIGLALYGRTFTLTSPSQTGMGAPVRGPGRAGQFTSEGGFISFYEVCQMIQHGAQIHDEPEQHVRYLSSGDQWVGYEDPRSLTEKTCYVKQNGYGGIMVWALDLDDFSGAFCNAGRYPLMHAINTELNNPSFNNCPNPNQAPVVTTAPVTSAVGTPPPSTPCNTQGFSVFGNTPCPNSQTQSVPSTTHAPLVTAPQPVTASPSPTGLISTASWFSCMNMPNDFYPNAYACDQYIICANQVSYQVNCAIGLNYNAVTKFCDWPENVGGCYNPARGTFPPPPSTPKTSTIASSAYVEFCHTRNDGYYRDPNNCNVYIQCLLSQPVVKTCPIGLVFNEAMGKCDFPSLVRECSTYRPL